MTLTFEPQNSTTSTVSQGYSPHQVWTLWDHSFLSYAEDKQTNKQTDSKILATPYIESGLSINTTTAAATTTTMHISSTMKVGPWTDDACHCRRPPVVVWCHPTLCGRSRRTCGNHCWERTAHTYVPTQTYTYIQTDRQTDIYIQTDRQTDRQTSHNNVN